MHVSIEHFFIFYPDLTSDVAFVNNEGAGYFQDRFSVRCTSAGCNSPPITKDVLAVRKLAEDLVRNDMTACSHLA